jgi:alcohol dehydrogenase class IV
VTRFNLSESPQATARLASAFSGRDPAKTLATMLQQFPIPQRLRDVGFERAKIEGAALQVAEIGIKSPRAVAAEDVRAILTAAF